MMKPFESSKGLITCVIEQLKHFDNHSAQSLVNPENNRSCNTKGLTVKGTDALPPKQDLWLYH